MGGSYEETEIDFSSLDGLRLSGTLTVPREVHTQPVVLVHGGGVTREEGGFFSRVAWGLAEESGTCSLRFDLRAHGKSAGRKAELTLSGVVNDIRSAVERVLSVRGNTKVHVIGASFGGGLSAFFASQYPELVQSLILVNPLFNYKKRLLEEKSFWGIDKLDEFAGRDLTERGFVPHFSSLEMGRALVNELFYLRPEATVGKIVAPTMIVHGTHDTFIPFQSSVDILEKFSSETRLLKIDGAQHGIAVHDDPGYKDPQTQRWQALVIEEVARWISSRS